MSSVGKRLDDIQLNQDEISAGCSVVNEVVNNLLKALKADVPQLEIEKINTGSYYEGVKVAHPDEYDVMLSFCRKPEYGPNDLLPGVLNITYQVEALPGPYAAGPYARLRCSHHVPSQLPNDCILKRSPTDGLLLVDPMHFKRWFYHNVISACRQSLGGSIRDVDVKPPTRGPNIMIIIKTTSGKKYDVDLVPAYIIRSFSQIVQAKVPSWMTPEEKQKMEESRCYLVPKSCKEGLDASFSWRYSFSAQEKEIVLHLPTKMKSALRVFKDDLEKLKESRERQGLPKLSVTSYHLKTVLLNLLEELPRKDWDEHPLEAMYVMLVTSFREALEKKDLRHQFLPSYNLMQDLSDDESRCLCRWCQDALGKLVVGKEPAVATRDTVTKTPGNHSFYAM